MNWMLLPYRRYFEFRGRSRRREFWLFLLFYFLVATAIQFAFGMPYQLRAGFSFTYGTILSDRGQLILNLFGLASFIPGLAVHVRRMHDIDRSGWWTLLWIIPIFGWIVVLVFLFLDGSVGSNRYGADPKARGMTDIFA